MRPHGAAGAWDYRGAAFAAISNGPSLRGRPSSCCRFVDGVLCFLDTSIREMIEIVGQILIEGFKEETEETTATGDEQRNKQQYQ